MVPGAASSFRLGLRMDKSHTYTMEVFPPEIFFGNFNVEIRALWRIFGHLKITLSFLVVSKSAQYIGCGDDWGSSPSGQVGFNPSKPPLLGHRVCVVDIVFCRLLQRGTLWNGDIISRQLGLCFSRS